MKHTKWHPDRFSIIFTVNTSKQHHQVTGLVLITKYKYSTEKLLILKIKKMTSRKSLMRTEVKAINLLLMCSKLCCISHIGKRPS